MKSSVEDKFIGMKISVREEPEFIEPSEYRNCVILYYDTTATVELRAVAPNMNATYAISNFSTITYYAHLGFGESTMTKIMRNRHKIKW